MAQHDYTIANQTFPNTRTDLNNVFAAIVSQNSGATAPSTTYAYQLWYDTTTDILKMRNANDDAWIELFTIDQVADTASAAGAQGSNLIINGNMACSQRGTQTNQTSAYTACDRWNFIESGSTVITTSQSTDTPASQGFANSLKVAVTTDSGTPSASHYAIIRQKLEGQDLQHLLYGTSSAKKITLSFWVKSPKTGKQYVELYHTDAAYHNQQSYTIAAADTWQYVTLTYNGYETTAFDNDNGNSLMIQYWLMAGSDYTSGTTTENTWHNTNANRFSGLVNVVDNTANNWHITGVKLEVGSTATDFVHRSYGEELALCQRYYEEWGGEDAYQPFGYFEGTGTVGYSVFQFNEKRDSPTVTVSDAAHFQSTRGAVAFTAMSFSQPATTHVFCTISRSGNNWASGEMFSWRANNSTSARIYFNAEL